MGKKKNEAKESGATARVPGALVEKELEKKKRVKRVMTAEGMAKWENMSMAVALAVGHIDIDSHKPPEETDYLIVDPTVPAHAEAIKRINAAKKILKGVIKSSIVLRKEFESRDKKRQEKKARLLAEIEKIDAESAPADDSQGSAEN